VRAPVVAVDVVGDLLPCLVEGLELGAPDEPLFQLPEPAFDEGLRFGVSVAAASVGDAVLGESVAEAAAGESRSVVGAECQLAALDATRGDCVVDEVDRLVGAAAQLERPTDDLARAAVDRRVQVGVFQATESFSASFAVLTRPCDAARAFRRYVDDGVGNALLMGMPGAAIGRGGSAVLEDPTGRRARWLRRAGRVVFLLFLGWLLAIVLGGLGLVPVPGVPLARVLQPAQGPPALTKLPQPRQPSASDLRPAVTAAVFAAGVGSSHGKSASAPGKTKTTAPTANGSPGKSATAPGKTKTTTTLPAVHGKSTAAPGKTKTITTATTTIRKTTTTSANNGKNSVAPGKTKTSATTTTSSVGLSKKP